MTFMKNNFVKFTAALLALTLVSCLDDDKYALDPSGTNNVIEFVDPQVPNSPFGAIYPAWVEAYTIAPSATFTRTIRYSGPQDNDKDIVVTVAVDPVALEDYNRHMDEGIDGSDALHGNTFELLPASNYQIDNATITIPAGQKEAQVSVTIFPELFDLTKSYALPLRIVSASSGVLSKHYSVGIFGVGIKNKYDAVYNANVQLTGWLAYSISEAAQDYPDGIGLVTTGPNSVGIANYLRGDNLLPGFSLNADGSTGATGFGAASPVFTFDANNKLINVDNAIADDGRGRDFELNPAATAEENVFDPVNRTLNANFLFKQNGRPTAVVKWKLEFESER